MFIPSFFIFGKIQGGIITYLATYGNNSAQPIYPGSTIVSINGRADPHHIIRGGTLNARV